MLTPPPDADEPYFLGWRMESGELVQPGSSFEVRRELAGEDDAYTLTAVWGPAAAVTTLAYEPGEGAGERSSSWHVNNDGVTLPDAADLGFVAPEGHVFSGWQAADGRMFAAGQRVVVDDLNASEENVLTAQWVPRADLSYAVRYVWAGSEVEIAQAKVVAGVTHGTASLEAPIDVAGYTPVSSEPVRIEVTDDSIVEDIPYYKNVDLTANSTTDFVYDGTEKQVSGYACSEGGVQFDGIVVGAPGVDAGSYPAAFGEGAVGSVDASGRYHRGADTRRHAEDRARPDC